MSASLTPALELERVEVTYGNGSISALRGVSLHVPPGTIVALLGVNGSGKTTLLRTVTGLLGMNNGRLRSGSVRFGDRDITRSESSRIVRAGISQVMEGRRVFANLTVEDNLRAGGFIVHGRQRHNTLLEHVMTLFPRLAERRRQPAGLLSGGEQQMLAIGRALMQEPKLLLLDEPSLGLAPLVIEQIREVLSQINREQGTSMVVIEQNAAVGLSMSHYAYVMEQGVVAKEGLSAALLVDDEVRHLYLGIGAEGRRSYRDVRDRVRSARP